MKLIYLSSNAIQSFCTRNPIQWFTRELAEQGDVLTPTPGMQVFFDMLLDSNRLFTQAQYYEKACAVSGYLLGVHPFNQPGVESYKKNMFALLGKPGYEEMREALLDKLKD